MHAVVMVVLRTSTAVRHNQQDTLLVENCTHVNTRVLYTNSDLDTRLTEQFSIIITLLIVREMLL